MAEDSKKCESMKNGKQCGAYRITNSRFCFIHAPEMVHEREKALEKAAQAREIYLSPAPGGTQITVHLPKKVNLAKSKDIKKAYTSIIKAAFAGLLNNGEVGTLTYALNGYCGQLEKLELLERIEKLEKAIKKRGLLDGSGEKT